MTRAAGSLPDYSPSLRPSGGVFGFWQRLLARIWPSNLGDGVGFPSASSAVPADMPILAGVGATNAVDLVLSFLNAAAAERTGGVFRPAADNKHDLGTAAARWRAALVKALNANGVVQFPATTAAALGANTDNWAGADNARTVRLSASAAYELRGIANGADGRVIVLHNVGSFAVTIIEEASSSTAANRILTGAGNFTLSPDTSIRLEYDATSSRWRMTAAGTPLPQPLDTTDSPAFAGANIGYLTVRDELYLYNDGTISISADQNNYDLDASSSLPVYRFSTDASRAFTGFVADSFRQVVIVNAGANPLVLANESTSSTTSNRIVTGTNSNLTLLPAQSAFLWYDFSTGRWRVVASTANPTLGAQTSVEFDTQSSDISGAAATKAFLWFKRTSTTNSNLTVTDGDGNHYPVPSDEVNVVPSPSDGGTTNIGAARTFHEEHLNNTAVFATYTVNFTGTPSRNARIRIISRGGITALTINASLFVTPTTTGTSVVRAAPAGVALEYRWIESTGAWWPCA